MTVIYVKEKENKVTLKWKLYESKIGEYLYTYVVLAAGVADEKLSTIQLSGQSLYYNRL